MSSDEWSAATWKASRRAHIRRTLDLTVRERLEGLEALTETSEKLAWVASRLPTEATAGPRQRILSGSAEPEGRHALESLAAEFEEMHYDALLVSSPSSRMRDSSN